MVAETSAITPGAATAAAGACCDGKSERDLLRRAAATETTLHERLEKQRTILVEQRTALNQKVVAAESELEKQRAAFKQVEDEAVRESRRGDVAIDDLMDEATELSEDIEAASAKLVDMRERSEKMRENDKFELEVARSLHRLYAGMTGIRWNFDVDGATCGHVALNSVKYFDLKSLSQKDSSDVAWQAIESCLKVGMMAA